MKNPKLWEELAAKPPKCWVFCENKTGKYIEGPDPSDQMAYERFCNVCAEERKKIKG